jgi:VIT1/CCC1 family predicted Fe2+/Mn2+ transporter
MVTHLIHSVPYEQKIYHKQTDPHRRASGLSDIILGGQDGLVNVLGVILGVAAATSDPRIVLVAGLAATFAESVSMGAVAYTSTLADADFYESEKAREYRHLKHVPDVEREEILEIYRQKGFEGDLLNRIVDTITANKDVWVAVMMAEEHQLSPRDRKQALRSAGIVGVSAVIGSLLPLMPFFGVRVVCRWCV